MLLKKNKPADAAALICQAQQLNGDSYYPPLLLGRIAFEAKQWDSARQFLTKAQSLCPPFAGQRQEIEKKLKHIDKMVTKK